MEQTAISNEKKEISEADLYKKYIGIRKRNYLYSEWKKDVQRYLTRFDTDQTLNDEKKRLEFTQRTRKANKEELLTVLLASLVPIMVAYGTWLISAYYQSTDVTGYVTELAISENIPVEEILSTLQSIQGISFNTGTKLIACVVAVALIYVAAVLIFASITKKSRINTIIFRDELIKEIREKQKKRKTKKR